jgi:mono/diheme cytochrome c family protein
LPCDVQAVFVNNCASCHGTTPSGGAPRSLVTYANLTLSDPANTSMTEAQVALQRIQSTVAPMPPLPTKPLSSSDVSIIQNWISSGYPKGSCGSSTGGSGGGGNGGSGNGGASGSGSGGSGGSSSGGDAGVVANGLPCNIQSIVVNSCASCHGSSPSGGAPRSLITYANLTMSDPANSSMTEAQVALQRMQNTVAPMPPAPAAPVSSTDITAFQNWINSGYPKGTCGATGGSGGSASGGSGGGGIGGAGGSSGGSDAGVAGGVLPCDVQTLLVNRCDSCHGSTPAGGAPRSLVTYSNLTMADPANTSMTEAQVALQRMQNTTSPMPPSPASLATSAEMTALQNWINAGYPSGPGCTGDAGTIGPDPLNASPTCTSNTTWTRGNNGSSSMNPGQACISCHSSSGGEGPRYVIAGTLYPTGHEPNNCNGTNGNTGARVVVTGSNGTSVTLTPNSAGNFYSSTSLAGPYKAKVVDSAGKERVMVSAAPNGDCNTCHTQTGANSAPGRITLP